MDELQGFPELNGGRKSRLQVFEGNGTVGVDIFGHGNFLRHLRYFIHGAALPERIKTQMAELIDDPSYFTSGDLEPARKLARQLARSSGLRSAASDSFFQLMNDLGLNASCADSVRRAVFLCGRGGILPSSDIFQVRLACAFLRYRNSRIFINFFKMDRRSNKSARAMP